MSDYVFGLIEKEAERQRDTVNLIASENYPSNDVMRALGSCLMNKYTEGFPEIRTTGRTGRYYGGCYIIDELEEYCCTQWKRVFCTDYHVNVQPHSGSQANAAAYAAFLNPGDTVLSLDLDDGGHLSHGSKANFSGKIYNCVFYGLTEDGFIDYEDICRKIVKYHPKLVLAGASAYSREIDFRKIASIIRDAKEIDPYYTVHELYFMADIAHIAGLIAAGVHQSPFGLADVITTTTHKTLRGPRGGLIFCRRPYAERVDGAVFPGTQGGPLQNVIAAKAIAAEEAMKPEFHAYIHDVVKNASAMARELILLGYDVVTGGTDNHMFLLDFSKTHPDVTGRMVQEQLEWEDITVNRNCVPNDLRGPLEASGIRIGTAAETSRGKTTEDFIELARGIDYIIRDMWGSPRCLDIEDAPVFSTDGPEF